MVASIDLPFLILLDLIFLLEHTFIGSQLFQGLLCTQHVISNPWNTIHTGQQASRCACEHLVYITCTWVQIICHLASVCTVAVIKHSMSAG